MHRVVRDGRQRVAVAVQQAPFDAVGAQHRDGNQPSVTHDGADLAGQRDRHGAGRATQRATDLGALVLSGRQLEVPAGVVATGPAAQRDVVPGQAPIGRVEVRGVQLQLHRLAHHGNHGEIRQDRAGLNIELALNLAVTIHGLSLPHISPRHQPALDGLPEPRNRLRTPIAASTETTCTARWMLSIPSNSAATSASYSDRTLERSGGRSEISASRCAPLVNPLRRPKVAPSVIWTHSHQRWVCAPEW